MAMENIEKEEELSVTVDDEPVAEPQSAKSEAEFSWGDEEESFQRRPAPVIEQVQPEEEASIVNETSEPIEVEEEEEEEEDEDDEE